VQRKTPQRHREHQALGLDQRRQGRGCWTKPRRWAEPQAQFRLHSP